jgi:hypothetical protein
MPLFAKGIEFVKLGKISKNELKIHFIAARDKKK